MEQRQKQTAELERVLAQIRAQAKGPRRRRPEQQAQSAGDELERFGALARQALEQLGEGVDLDVGPTRGGGGRGWLKRLLWRPAHGALFATIDAQRQFNVRLTELLGLLLQFLERERLEAARERGGLPFQVEELEAQVERLAGEIRDLERKLGQVESRVLAYLEGAAAEAPAPAAGAEETSAGGAQTLIEQYVNSAFQDRYRGAEEVIRARFERYVPYLAGCEQVVDLGCGRGELLSLLQEHGIGAYGVDTDPQRVRRLLEQGFSAIQGDAVEHLAGLAEGSLDGVFAAQLVEHLPAAALLKLLAAAARALRPGGRLILETVNPTSFYSLAENFFRDPSHRQPLHPETLSFLVGLHGFEELDVLYGTPVPLERRLAAAPEQRAFRDDPALAALAQDVARLDGLLFGPQDYAVVARRGPARKS